MKFNTEVWCMGEKLSNTMEGIEVANYDQLSNLTIDSELVTFMQNNMIPDIVNVISENNDPYKINIETIEYNIWVPYSNSNTGITFKLEVITTDSTVAELSSGGGMPTDLELNSLKVTGTLSVDGSNVYLKGGNKLDIGTEKNDIITATN